MFKVQTQCKVFLLQRQTKVTEMFQSGAFTFQIKCKKKVLTFLHVVNRLTIEFAEA